MRDLVGKETGTRWDAGEVRRGMEEMAASRESLA